jgi:hypothetical protein
MNHISVRISVAELSTRAASGKMWLASLARFCSDKLSAQIVIESICGNPSSGAKRKLLKSHSIDGSEGKSFPLQGSIVPVTTKRYQRRGPKPATCRNHLIRNRLDQLPAVRPKVRF